jgi:hypothetical protein
MASKATFAASFATGKVDRDKGIIHGVSVITEGPARGHDTMVDAETLRTVHAAAKKHPHGLKVKMQHRTDVKDIVGRLQNFRIDGKSLRADLLLLDSSEQREKIFEMAEEMPTEFGLSISFELFFEESGGINYARCGDIYSCDIVDDPAANPNGLFSVVDSHEQTNMSTEADKATFAAKTEVTELAAKLTASESRVTELSAKLEQYEARFSAIEDLLNGVATKEEIKAFATKVEVAGFASKEEVKTVADTVESVNKLASRKLAAMGVEYERIPAAEKAASQGLLAQYEAITSPSEKAEFLKKHKDEIFGSR